MMVLGASYYIYSVLLFTTIALYVDEDIIGKAFGTVNLFLNLGRVVFPPIVGKLIEYGYFWV